MRRFFRNFGRNTAGFLRWIIFWGTGIGAGAGGAILAMEFLPNFLALPLPENVQSFWPAKEAMKVAERSLTVSPETRAALHDRSDKGSWLFAIFKEIALGLLGMVFGLFAVLLSSLIFLLLWIWNFLHVPLLGAAAGLFLWAVIAAALGAHAAPSRAPALLRTKQGLRQRNRYVL